MMRGNRSLQLAWLDKRIIQDSWRLAKDSPNFPAWVCKVVGGTTVQLGEGAHCGSKIMNFAPKMCTVRSRETNLLNWPLTLAELEPYYDKAEDKLGVTGTHGIPLLDADNIRLSWRQEPKGWLQGDVPQAIWLLIHVRATDVRLTIQDGFCFQGIRSNAKWSTLNAKFPKARRLATLKCVPQCTRPKHEHDKSGKGYWGRVCRQAGHIISGSEARMCALR